MATCYPPTKPTRSAVPTFEPVTLEEAKAQCRVEGLDHHDSDLGRLIKEAREQVERDALLVCATGSYTFKMTDFGGRAWFELPSSLRPVTAVTAITYVATDGTVTTWSTSEYSLDTYSIVPTVRLVYGYSWPVLRGDYSGITVTATVGYASQTAIPERVKAAVKLWLWIRFEEEMNPTQDMRRAVERYESLVEGLRRDVYA
jgi:uncharacterized phiE125 gp8 family phage protein